MTDSTDDVRTTYPYGASPVFVGTCGTFVLLLLRSNKNKVVRHEWGNGECDYDKRNISVVICDTDIP
jgi:hypothetical protein